MSPSYNYKAVENNRNWIEFDNHDRNTVFETEKYSLEFFTKIEKLFSTLKTEQNYKVNCHQSTNKTVSAAHYLDQTFIHESWI